MEKQCSNPGTNQSQPKVIAEVDWQVDEERAVRIRQQPDKMILPSRLFGGQHRHRFQALPFRKNISVCFIHHIT